MKSKKKMMTTALAVALAVLLLIGGGTFAYLQSTTGDVENNFNANKVTVNLTETTGSDYNIVPGTEQDKNPTVKVSATVPAYVYVEVTDTTDGLVGYEIADGWLKLNGYDNVYYREVSGTEGDQSFPVLKDNKVTYSSALENSDMIEHGQLKDGLNLTFKAHAIQKEGFKDAVAAYKQIPEQVATTEEYAAALEENAKGNNTTNISVTNDLNNAKGIKSAEGSNLNVDFNGHTIQVTSPVGSSNTVTNGMQLLKGSKNVIQNGTYISGSNDMYIMVQNYSDLTLKNVTLDATKSKGCQYVLSCNYGNTRITGNTNLIAPAGFYALDVMHWVNASYKDGVKVTIDENMTGTVDGKIDVYKYTNKKDYDDLSKARLIIKGGTFKNTGLTLEQFKKFVADGYKVTDNNGVYTVSK